MHNDTYQRQQPAGVDGYHGEDRRLPTGPSIADGSGRHPLMAEIERLRNELARSDERATNLEIALAGAREIGAAIGILMATHRVTYDRGFDMLRQSSQHTHRKLREVAADVMMTGALPE